MTTPTSVDGGAAPDLALRSLRRRLVAWAAATEFVPLYAVYALLFEDAGLTPASISIGFAAWSATAVVFEVPSGALADRVSRRGLLVASTLLRAAGFTVWLAAPGLAGVVAGFVLWGMSGAASSGTWQALVWDELARLGRTDAYTTVTARMAQAEGVAIVVALLGAAPLVAAFGLVGVGVISIALHVVTIGLVLSVPEVRAMRGVDEPTGWSAWAATLRTGVRAATRTPVLARLVALGALLEVVTVIEEYVPLLARDLGAADVWVPVLVVLPWVGNLVGAEVAARRPDLAPRAAAAVVLVGGGGLVGGALSGHPLGIVGIGAMYAVVKTAIVLTDARMQEHAPDAVRATVASVRGFVTELLAIAAFGVVGALSAGVGLPVAVALMAVPLVVGAALTPGWLPPGAAGAPGVVRAAGGQSRGDRPGRSS